MARRVAIAGALASPLTFAVGFIAGIAVADRWNRALK